MTEVLASSQRRMKLNQIVESITAVVDEEIDRRIFHGAVLIREKRKELFSKLLLLSDDEQEAIEQLLQLNAVSTSTNTTL